MMKSLLSKLPRADNRYQCTKQTQFEFPTSSIIIMKNQAKVPSAEVITRTPFPQSKKIYVKGTLHDVKVAMREIETSDEYEVKNGSYKKEKAKITVYDTSGPYTDPEKNVDVTLGLQPLRRE